MRRRNRASSRPHELAPCSYASGIIVSASIVRIAPAANARTNATTLGEELTERTYLAWWRSGLAALAVGLAAGRLVPELSSGASWPYELLGVGYSLLGVAFISYGHRRQRVVEAAVRRGEWAPLDARITAALTAIGILLGAATIAIVVFAGS
jgi:putative membrane protein